MKSLQALNELSKPVKGKQLTPQFMEQMFQKMKSFYAPTMSCQAAQHSSMTFSLTDVSPDECFQAVGQMMASAKIVDFDMKDIAIDPASGGKTLLQYQACDLAGTGAKGQTVPGTKVDDSVVNWLYEFNDDGLIHNFKMDFDSSIVHGIMQRVQAYTAEQASRTVLTGSFASWAEVGLRNIETIQTLNRLSDMLKGNQITPALMKSMSDQMESHYAPTMTCISGKGTKLSIHLEAVSPGECFQSFAQMFGFCKVVDFVIKDLAIDPMSGGKTVLGYNAVDFVGTMRTGEEVPDTMKKGVVMNFRYKFNDHGLISHMEQEFDSALFEMMSTRVTSFAKGELVSTGLVVEESRDWVEAGQRNLASLEKMDRLDQAVKGKQITPTMMAKLSNDQMALYAPRMTCILAKQSGVGTHMTDVSPGECFQAIGKMWQNVKVADFVNKNKAIAPNSGGMTLLSRMHANVFGAAQDGQMVPGTKVDDMILNQRVKFNKEGLIHHFEQEFDSGILRKMDMMVKQSQSDIALMESEAYSSFTMSSVTLLLGAVAAVLILSALFWKQGKAGKGYTLLENAC